MNAKATLVLAAATFAVGTGGYVATAIPHEVTWAFAPLTTAQLHPPASPGARYPSALDFESPDRPAAAWLAEFPTPTSAAADSLAAAAAPSESPVAVLAARDNEAPLTPEQSGERHAAVPVPAPVVPSDPEPRPAAVPQSEKPRYVWAYPYFIPTAPARTRETPESTVPDSGAPAVQVSGVAAAAVAAGDAPSVHEVPAPTPAPTAAPTPAPTPTPAPAPVTAAGDDLSDDGDRHDGGDDDKKEVRRSTSRDGDDDDDRDARESSKRKSDDRDRRDDD